MMAHKTEALFRDDAYLAMADAAVAAVNDRGGIIFDRTIFYATSGGQPGDTGYLERADGSRIVIAATITGETKDEIIHVPAPEQAALAVAICLPSFARFRSPVRRFPRTIAGSISTFRTPASRRKRSPRA